MSVIVKRLLIFFTGVPAVAALVLFLPYYGNLALNIIVIVFSSIGAYEFSIMLEKKQMAVNKIQALFFGALLPLALTLTISFGCPDWIIPLLIMAEAFFILITRAFSKAANMDNVTNNLAGELSVLVYPSFFMYWLVKMSVWKNPGVYILVFLLITLCSDASAWLTGILLGNNNRGIFAASPNKSIAGFIGGIAGSMIISTAAVLIIPSAFSGRYENVSVIIIMNITGIFTETAAAFGDLFESAVKRSCGVKDSGNLMLGRGGVLDSIDSITLAAPVYFFLVSVFFNNI
ncbi:MAG: phosphatidate cytidylyltransferase [Treponema sp.]|jgi:phosphatidate cytidylyltransferase|nr:phosphatidate cytidylyltransferase [Treponema sp.]